MREYEAKFDLTDNGEDWSAWETLDRLLAERIPDTDNTYPYPYRVIFEDGKAEAGSFAEAREHARGEHVESFEITRADSAGFWIEFEYRSPWLSRVRSRGPNQEQVFGFIATVERQLEKGQQPPEQQNVIAPGEAESDSVGPADPQPETGRSWWHDPNQWVLVIVGTAVAGIIVWGITALL